jgi:hypothetical protein
MVAGLVANLMCLARVAGCVAASALPSIVPGEPFDAALFWDIDPGGRQKVARCPLGRAQEKRMQTVILNGSPYDPFDAGKECIVLPGTLQGRQEFVVRYSSRNR